MNDLIAKDLSARNKISSEIFTNFFVEAGAGSGKTYTLVERMSNMIEKGIDISKICAITFTNAAANEFYSRFYNKLVEKSKDSKICDRIRKYINDAIKNFDSCFMGTIDSFCQLIISEHPNIAGIPSNSKVLNNEQLINAYVLEFNKIINGEFNDVDCSIQKKAFNFIKINERNAEEIFTTGIKEILNTRNFKHIVPTKDPVKSLDQKYKHLKTRLIELLSKIDKNLNQYIYESNRTGANNQQHIENFNNVYNKVFIIKNSWDSKSLSIEKILSNCLKIKLKLNFEYLDYYSDMLETVQTSAGKPSYIGFKTNLINNIIEDIKYLRYYINIDFFISSFNLIEPMLKNNGIFSFFDFQYYLANMLRDSALSNNKLINYIAKKHSYFLIDEFQDTNPIQSEIFFYLAAKKIEKKWYECEPRDGSLFIVGDPKQSIYRFRYADVSSYLFVKQIFESGAGIVVELTKNWRSTDTICKYFNDIFTKLLPEDNWNQRKFSLIPIDRSNNKENNIFVGIYKYFLIKKSRSDPLEEEAYQISKIIHSLTTNKKLFIYDSKNNSLRNIKYKDFMIITRNTTKLKFYTDALKNNNINVETEGYAPFNDCSILKALFDILIVIAYPDNSIYLYKLLKSNLFSLTNKQIQEIISRCKVLSLKALLNDNNDTAIYKIGEKLNWAKNIFNKTSIISSIDLIIENFKLYKYYDIESLNCLYYTKELIRDKIATGLITNLSQVCSFLSEIFLNNTDIDRCPSLSNETNKVKIANVHKVKGLEAPIIILAQPYSTSKVNSSYRVEQTKDHNICWFYSLTHNSKNSFFKQDVLNANIYNDEEERERECLEAELLRLKYVAATRAKNAIIIPDYIKSDGNKIVNFWGDLITDKFVNINTIIKDYNENKGTRRFVDPDEVYKNKYDKPFFNNSKKIYSYQIVNPSKLDEIEFSDCKHHNLSGKKNLSVNIKRNYIDPKLCGSIVHRFMELLIKFNINKYNKDFIKFILNEFDVADNKYYAEILENIFITMKNGGYKQSHKFCPNDDLLETLKNSIEIYCEVPFTYKKVTNEDNNKIISGVIDLLYKDKDGWHIIDYKTDFDYSDIDNKYKDQLNLYVEAVQDCENLKINDAKIYHICI